MVPPRCDDGPNSFEARGQQRACFRHVPSESGPKRITVWFWLALVDWLAGSGRSTVVAVADWLQLHHGHELVVVAAVPSPEADDVKDGLWVDGVVKRSRLVVEQLGGIDGESRNRCGVDQAGSVNVNVLDKGGRVPTTRVRDVDAK